MKRPRWITCVAVTLSIGVAMLAGPAVAQSDASSYPTRTIRMIVAYPPGGPLDIMARAISEQLAKLLGQPVIVENRPGAGGLIGTEIAARAEPDGYTLLYTSTPLSIQETMFAKLPYSALRDFTPIAKVAEGPQLLVVGMSVPVNSVSELIAYAKEQDGKLNYASPSAGGSNHLAAELFKSMAGFKATHIPYKGGAPAEMDVMSGQVTFMFGALTSAMKQVKAGRLKALGVSSKTRMQSAPDVPTIAESGLPGFEVTSWYGIVGPASMPAPIVKKLNQVINQVLNEPSMQQRLIAMDLDATPGSPEQFGQFIETNVGMWKKVVTDAGLAGTSGG
jgi:tripartite-type tricarboxylate transporter receptor subunit TctC